MSRQTDAWSSPRATARTVLPRTSPILVGDEHVVRFYAEKYAPGRPLMLAGASAEKEALLYHPVAALETAAFKPGQGNAEGGLATRRLC